MNILSKAAVRALRASNKLLEQAAELQKRRVCMSGEDVCLFAQCRLDNMQSSPRAIRIGSHSRILGQLLVFAHGGEIQLGESCFVGECSRIWSAASIMVGNRVLISHGVNIHDTVSHSFSAEQRSKHFENIFTSGHPSEFDDPPLRRPIVIEDDAWLGFNSVILKGVTIGKGAIIGASSVITKSVAPFSIVAGNPARVVGRATP